MELKDAGVGMRLDNLTQPHRQLSFASPHLPHVAIYRLRLPRQRSKSIGLENLAAFLDHV
jgi:hypothetical protein